MNKYNKILITLLFITLSIYVLIPSYPSGAVRSPINPCYLFKATYYCPDACCNGIWAGFTKTGKPLEYGVVAIDPKYWTMGQKFKIKQLDNSMIFSAEDVGSAIKGKKRIDICVNSHKETLSGHPEHVIVEVIKKS